MKIYNNINGVIIVLILFNVAMLYHGKYNCSCDVEHTKCVRHEILGVQYSHLYFFIFIGFFFPSYFWTFQIVGLLWEFFEIFLDRNESETIKYLDGCLSKKPKHIGEQSIYNFKVYKNVDKYLNPVDRFFNIKNSKIHFWHGSIAEVVLNVIAFFIGFGLNKLLLK